MDRAQWMVIHLTASRAHADACIAFLQGEGIMARHKPACRSVSSGEEYYEIQVLGAEAREAQQLLISRNLLR